MSFLKTYGVEGPLGFPCTEKQARNLDALLKVLPKSQEFAYKKTLQLKAPTDVNPGERSDVSWISTETPDRYGHVVFAKGMNDSQFALNPIVTLNHYYQSPPIGRSLWRKFIKDGDQRGIKAKRRRAYPADSGVIVVREGRRIVAIYTDAYGEILAEQEIGCRRLFRERLDALRRGCAEFCLTARSRVS